MRPSHPAFGDFLLYGSIPGKLGYVTRCRCGCREIRACFVLQVNDQVDARLFCQEAAFDLARSVFGAPVDGAAEEPGEAGAASGCGPDQHGSAAGEPDRADG